MRALPTRALRAYLLVAAAAAVVVDLVVIYAGFVLQIPDSAFRSAHFQIAAAIAVAGITLAVRIRYGFAFRSAPRNSNALG